MFGMKLKKARHHFPKSSRAFGEKHGCFVRKTGMLFIQNIYVFFGGLFIDKIFVVNVLFSIYYKNRQKRGQCRRLPPFSFRRYEYRLKHPPNALFEAWEVLYMLNLF